MDLLSNMRRTLLGRLESEKLEFSDTESQVI